MNWKGMNEKVTLAGNIIYSDDAFNSVICTLSGEYNFEITKSHGEIIVDALNTIQQCDKLPSELLAERDELLASLKDLQAAQNGPPLIREQDYWQACMKRADNIINKIEHGK